MASRAVLCPVGMISPYAVHEIKHGVLRASRIARRCVNDHTRPFTPTDFEAYTTVWALPTGPPLWCSSNPWGARFDCAATGTAEELATNKISKGRKTYDRFMTKIPDQLRRHAGVNPLTRPSATHSPTGRGKESAVHSESFPLPTRETPM